MITSSSSPVFADNYRMKKNFFIIGLLAAIILVFPVFSVQAQTSTASTQAILEQISRLLGGYNYDAAIALFDTISPDEAASSPIRLLKASVLNSAGRTSEARAIAEEIAAREPNNIDALFVLSAVEAMSGRTTQQRTVLERILSADPRNVYALTDLGALHLQLRSFRNAEEYYDKVLEIDPSNLDALLGKATIYRLNRDPHNAEAMLNQAVRYHPNNAAPYHERARLYNGAGFPINALDDLDKAKELNSFDYWIAFDRGSTLLDLYRREQALEEFERAVRINPREFMGYVYTAGLKDELGDWDGAERDYEILARLKPDYYFAFEGVGLHKMRRGQWAEARDAFLEVYRQAPNEYFYALLAAANWMRADNVTGPRQFLNQAMARVNRESIEYYMLRLYYDMTGRVYSGENDMIFRIDRETNLNVKAQMTFYFALYHDIRGNLNSANVYYLQFKEMNRMYLVEWRLNEWILANRGLLPY